MKKLLFAMFLMVFSPQLLIAATPNTSESSGVDVVRAIGDEVRKTGGALGDGVISVSTAASSEFNSIFMMAEAIIEKYGSSTIELGLTVLRIQAWSEILAPLVSMIIFSIVAYISFRYVRPKPYNGAKLRQWYENTRLMEALQKPYNARSGTEDILICREIGNDSKSMKTVGASITYEEFVFIMNASPPFTTENQVAIVISGISSMFAVASLFILISELWAIVGVFYPQVYGLHLMMAR